MLDQNKKLLSQLAHHTLTELEEYEKTKRNTYSEVLTARSGQSTIQVSVNGNMHLVHSKYDPKKESERFISQFQEIADQYDHVLFYGIGFGYHIKEFMLHFPAYTFSIYEPEIEIFYQFMNHCRLTEFPLERLNGILVETNRDKGKRFLNSKIHYIQERILLVTLPSYERIFQDKFKAFKEDFKAALGAKRQSHYVNMNFSARWTLNSLINLKTTFQTPNILEGFEKSFANKPLIIVAAGPSLEDEYENLRYIKDNRLAYIFAVGSANRALIAQNILPDAVCTYDPQDHNYNVFAPLYENGITSVPMIYGTSVGFETLKMYKGPKLHMITDQDTISPFYLKKKNNDPLKIIQDSPTIAAVTFQLASKLGCNPIIFVGQNLGFRNNQFYSKDVNYVGRTSQIMDKDLVDQILVEDVFGNQIETNRGFNHMRENIEWYISMYPEIEVLNTTKGGAAIKGSKFQSLDELISDRLTSSVVIDNWHVKNEKYYYKDSLIGAIHKMERSIKDCNNIYYEIRSIFAHMEQNIESNKENLLSKNIIKFEKWMKKLIQTDCYKVFLEPVNREHFQALSIKSAKIRKQIKDIDKAKLIIEAFRPYLNRCIQTLEQIVGSAYKVHHSLNPNENDYKYYPSDCGVFHYIGDWEQINYGPGKTIDFRIHQHIANKQGASVLFKFTGSSLNIYGSKRANASEKIKLTIDGKSEYISQKRYDKTKSDKTNFIELIVEKRNLKNQEHLVEIELQDDNLFYFTGIEINNDGRVLHINEVTNVEDLEIGKRIRCKYKAFYNRSGEFSGLGKENGVLLPVDTLAYPNGDFFLIMVEELNGKPILVSDRVIQNNISWDQLNSAGFIFGSEIAFNEKKALIRSMTGGIGFLDDNKEFRFEYSPKCYPFYNEWDKNKNIVNNIQNMFWCQEESVDGTFISKKGQKYSPKNKERTVRGGSSEEWGDFSLSPSNSVTNLIGFRPVLEIL